MVIVVEPTFLLTLNDFFSSPPSPLQPLHLPWLLSFSELYIKRDDQLHPQVSGNKWRKLRYVFDEHTRAVVSMGGPYSNHLHALAFLAREMGWHAQALVRGEPCQTPTLDDCARWGMALHFVSRHDYRQLRERDTYWKTLVPYDADDVWLPEGGRAVAAVRGVSELVAELPFVPDVVICAAGTGTTAVGLAAALPVTSRVIAISMIKNGDYLRRDSARLLAAATSAACAPIDWVFDLHRGGFARSDDELMAFIAQMATKFALPLEPVYTAKVLVALPTLAQRGLIHPSQRIVIIHTGGQQGARGFS